MCARIGMPRVDEQPPGGQVVERGCQRLSGVDPDEPGVELVNGQHPNSARLVISPCSRPARAAGLPGTTAPPPAGTIPRNTERP
jgi:hypothetical protein